MTAASGVTTPGEASAQSSSAVSGHRKPGEPTRLTGESNTLVLPLDGADWLLATDPRDEGREQKWYASPVKDAKPAKVPWVIQDPFPDYHGVAWYWRDFRVPANHHPGGRFLLRFHLVDYLAEVWVNGIRIGSHGQEPFVVDATAALRGSRQARLAVRVLSPTKEPINGIALHTVAEGRRDYPSPRDNAYATGGIAGSVELLVAPALRVEDLWVVPDWKTGEVHIRVNVINAGGSAIAARLQLTVAPSTTGEPAVTDAQEQNVAPGGRTVGAVLHVEDHRWWELNDPVYTG